MPSILSQRPFYELLGTREDNKRWVPYPGVHSAPLNELIREALAWLDKHLGRPVGQEGFEAASSR